MIVHNSFFVKLAERFGSKTYFFSLVLATVAYFAVVRLFQDWLYSRISVYVPFDLFPSFEHYVSPFIRPEPLEIPLYLLAFFLVPVLAYFLTPLIETISFRLKRENRDIMQPVIIFSERTVEWETRLKRFWPLLLIMLALLMFNPNFPVEPHHSNYFIGSVHEVNQGEALLHESSNLYGLFSIYFLIALFKLIPLSFTVFSLVIMVVYMVYYGALWVFVRRWLNSYTLATLATLVIIAVTYFFHTTQTKSILLLPAMSPFRWGLYVIVLFLMLGFEQTKKMKYAHWSLFVAAFSLFWNFDSGLFLSAATLGTVGYLKLCSIFCHPRESGDPEIKTNTKRSFDFLFSFLDSSSKAGMTMRKIVGVIVEYLGYVIGIFAVTSLINRLVYNSWPHWELFFRESKYFSQGIIMSPLPTVGLFEVLFFAYLAVFVSALFHALKRRAFPVPPLFLALYGAFSLIYYVGESTDRILCVVVAPFVLILTYAYQFCHSVLDTESRNEQPKQTDLSSQSFIWDLNNKNKKQKEFKPFGFTFGFLDSRSKLGMTCCRIIRSGFAILVFFNVTLLAFKLPVEFSVRNYHGIAKRFSSVDPRDQETLDDAHYLQQHYPQHRIPVMSLNDTKLMLYSNKVNTFDFYYIFTIYFKSEMQKYVDQVLRDRPEYVVIGKEKYRNDQVEYFLNGVKDLYRVNETLETVEVYEIRNSP